MSAPPPQVSIECDRLAVRQIYTRLANAVYPPSSYILSAGPNGQTEWVDPAALGQGETGPTGVQGPTGPTGHRGYQGPINEGYTGPQGVPGPRGYIGDQGLQGNQGPQGHTGIQGPQGVQGPTGPQGVQGVQGIQGPQGTTGATGPQGIQGPLPLPPINTYYWKYKTTWSTVVHANNGYFTYDSPTTLKFSDDDSNGVNRSDLFTSMEHIIDISGFNAIMQVVDASSSNQLVVYIPGGQERIGTTDKTVQFSYIMSGATTFIAEQTYAMSVMYGGTAGPQGATGTQGAQGPQGTTGFQGAQGHTGPQGPTGFQGIGPQGPTGPQGDQGVQGYQGHTGPTGPRGFQGVEGPPNPLAPVNYTVRLWWNGTGYDITKCDITPTGLTPSLIEYIAATDTFTIKNISRSAVIPNCITVFAATVLTDPIVVRWHNSSYNVGITGSEVYVDIPNKTIVLNNFNKTKLAKGGSSLSWPATYNGYIVYVNLTYFL